MKKLEKENSLLNFKNSIIIFRSIFKLRFSSKKDNIFIDATCGRGEDTKFLSTLGYVYSFDIQKEALKSAEDKIKALNKVELIHDSHENIDKYVEDEVDGVIFNLGYLPGGNKEITTKADSTIIALEKILKRLKPEGIVILILYPGHAEGLNEEKRLIEYINSLDQKKYIGIKLQYLNRINNSPYPLLIEKL